MRINVSINDTLLTQVDEYAKKFGYDRSELISQALRRMIFREIVKEESDKIMEGKEPDNERIMNAIDDMKTPEGGSETKSETPKKPGDVPREEVWKNRDGDMVVAKVRTGTCDNHYWDKVTYEKTYHIVYENEDGVKKIDHWLCPTCKDKVIELANDKGVIIST